LGNAPVQAACASGKGTPGARGMAGAGGVAVPDDAASIRVLVRFSFNVGNAKAVAVVVPTSSTIAQLKDKACARLLQPGGYTLSDFVLLLASCAAELDEDDLVSHACNTNEVLLLRTKSRLGGSDVGDMLDEMDETMSGMSGSAASGVPVRRAGAKLGAALGSKINGAKRPVNMTRGMSFVADPLRSNLAPAEQVVQATNVQCAMFVRFSLRRPIDLIVPYVFSGGWVDALIDAQMAEAEDTERCGRELKYHLMANIELSILLYVLLLPISTAFLEIAGDIVDFYDMLLLAFTSVWITMTSFAIAMAFSLHACIGPIHDANLLMWCKSNIGLIKWNNRFTPLASKGFLACCFVSVVRSTYKIPIEDVSPGMRNLRYVPFYCFIGCVALLYSYYIFLINVGSRQAVEARLFNPHPGVAAVTEHAATEGKHIGQREAALVLLRAARREEQIRTERTTQKTHMRKAMDQSDKTPHEFASVAVPNRKHPQVAKRNADMTAAASCDGQDDLVSAYSGYSNQSSVPTSVADQDPRFRAASPTPSNASHQSFQCLAKDTTHPGDLAADQQVLQNLKNEPTKLAIRQAPRSSDLAAGARVYKTTVQLNE